VDAADDGPGRGSFVLCPMTFSKKVGNCDDRSFLNNCDLLNNSMHILRALRRTYGVGSGVEEEWGNEV
jgi:hypothetical protein